MNNTLLGGQLGLDAMLWDNGANFSVTGIGKVGVFGNDADQVTTTAGVGGALPLVAASGGQASFVGELGLNARYQWTDRLSVIGGYNLLWVTGVGARPRSACHHRHHDRHCHPERRRHAVLSRRQCRAGIFVVGVGWDKAAAAAGPPMHRC